MNDQKLLYTAGHNVIIYSIDESTQLMLPGSENVEKISSIAVSKSSKYVAVCEKANRALCTIYELDTYRKKKVLPDPDIPVTDYEA